MFIRENFNIRFTLALCLNSICILLVTVGHHIACKLNINQSILSFSLLLFSFQATTKFYHAESCFTVIVLGKSLKFTRILMLGPVNTPFNRFTCDIFIFLHINLKQSLSLSNAFAYFWKRPILICKKEMQSSQPAPKDLY